VTDNVCCLVKLIQKYERIFAAVQFGIKLFYFFYRSKRLTDYIYTDIYCKISKCIGQNSCSYELFLFIKHLGAKLKFKPLSHNLFCRKFAAACRYSVGNVQCLSKNCLDCPRLPTTPLNVPFLLYEFRSVCFLTCQRK